MMSLNVTNPSFLRDLHPEIIITVLSTFDNPDDLYASIKACSVFYRVFCRYWKSILTSVGKNMVRGSAWKDAKNLLSYQRHIYKKVVDYEEFKKDIHSEFTIRKADIPQLRANQKVYRKFEEEIIDILEQRNDIEPLLGRNNSTIIPRDATPHQAFYRMWTISVRFQVETIDDFFRLEPYSRNPSNLLQALTKLMYSQFLLQKSPTGDRRYSTRSTLSMNLTEMWGPGKFTAAKHRLVPSNYLDFVVDNDDSVLLLKIKWEFHQHKNENDYSTLKTSIKADFDNPNLTVADLMGKYRLTANWTAWGTGPTVRLERPGRYSLHCFGPLYEYLD